MTIVGIKARAIFDTTSDTPWLVTAKSDGQTHAGVASQTLEDAVAALAASLPATDASGDALGYQIHLR
jgi:hypothetical protein